MTQGTQAEWDAAFDASRVPPLRIVTAAELLAMQTPARDDALAPVLPMPGLAMLYGPRGMGKTYVALSIGLASASGGTALRWRAPRSRRVLCIRRRDAGRAATGATRAPDPCDGSGATADALRFLAADLMDRGLPSIASTEMQHALDAAAADADVLILDNLSTLAGGIRENEADDWEPVQITGTDHHLPPPNPATAPSSRA